MNLSETTLITFEINDDCNMKEIHHDCPINKRKYTKKGKPLDNQFIIKSIKEARKLDFTGFIGFHYYNEPMMRIDDILYIINHFNNDVDFLLWTNALLLSKNIHENKFLKKFRCVVISNYLELEKEFLGQLRDYYKNIIFYEENFDNRANVYDNHEYNETRCKRPLYELPIDYYGNVHLCCIDWNNTYEIGNIIESSLTEVVKSERYQNVLKMAGSNEMNSLFPQLCRKCFKHLIRYTKKDFYNSMILRMDVNE